ncbi:hypothetical protein SADUNF_Sadunf08G0160200 [Salix dunnii]|uniref:Protein kinase domain-containing protein n=1 Tax=Salix dunnii TaxID=1413687 RepID=A0A835JUY1_9ROSI|nr:hypothetical protein SADUNF_Sadunf08G0160200 [Salix dunnii]
MSLGSEEGKVKSFWDVCKSKERKKKDGTQVGCWVKLRFVGSCISSRSKVDSSVSGTSNHFESKSTNDSSRDQPVAHAVSSSTTSNTESNSSLSKLEEELTVATRLWKFTFNDLKLATRNFRPESLLGEGGFGCVFKGWIEENGTAPVKPGTGLTVAVKTLNHDGLQGHKEWLTDTFEPEKGITPTIPSFCTFPKPSAFLFRHPLSAVQLYDVPPADRVGSSPNAKIGVRSQAGLLSRNGQQQRSFSIPNNSLASPFHRQYPHQSPKPNAKP